MARIIDTSTLLETTTLDYNARDWVYNGLDCCVTLEIFHALQKQMDPVARRTYEFELALQAPVMEMTTRGVLVDEERRREVLELYNKQATFLEDQLATIVSEGLDWSAPLLNKRWWASPMQLKNLFYDVMHLPAVRKRNTKGQFVPTVNREALENFQNYLLAEPLALHVLALRDLDKKRGFLRTAIDPDGRIRTNFNIAGTDTGRLSSSMSDFGTGGNLQNVDRELRSVFVADPGMIFVNVDLEQGDARNVGAICWDRFVDEHGEAFAGSYLDACESGDLHTYNCKLIWPEKPWTGNMKSDKAIAEEIFYRQDSFRQMSKKGGHGTNYYGTPPTMSKHLKVERAIIDEFQIRYFSAYPVIGCYDPNKTDPDHKLPNWHNWVINQITNFHSLTTMFGRRRMFFGRSSEASTIRQAIAYEPQSMTADEIDTGLLKVWRANIAQPLIQVHDSVLFQIPENHKDELVPQIIDMMRVTLPLKRGRDFVVPTEAKVGYNWGDWAMTNPDGLVKWKGSDNRKRERWPLGTRTFEQLFM